jgi:hypothetical protein
MSSGEIVPDVMTTLLNRSKTGFIASDGSRQLFGGIDPRHGRNNNSENAREVKNRIWNSGVIGFKRFEDE